VLLSFWNDTRSGVSMLDELWNNSVGCLLDGGHGLCGLNDNLLGCDCGGRVRGPRWLGDGLVEGRRNEVWNCCSNVDDWCQCRGKGYSRRKGRGDWLSDCQ